MISMMRGQSPPSELNFRKKRLIGFFKENLEREIISCFIFFGQNIVLFYFFKFILIKRAKLSKMSIFISITLKFAILPHYCNLRTQFYNEIFKLFARIHNLKISSFNKMSLVVIFACFRRNSLCAS